MIILTIELGLPIQFTVRADDNGTPRLSGSATVTVTVEDVNDNAPLFTSLSGYRFVLFGDDNCQRYLTPLPHFPESLLLKKN